MEVVFAIVILGLAFGLPLLTVIAILTGDFDTDDKNDNDLI